MAAALRSMSAFSIPSELLASLQVRSIQAQGTEDTPTATTTEDATPSASASAAVASSSGLGCQACPGAAFEHPEEQRAHFRSDWHRYNAKVKLAGQGKVVTADEWENMVEGKVATKDVHDGMLTDRRLQHLWLRIFRILRQLAVAHHTAAEQGQAHRRHRRRRRRLRRGGRASRRAPASAPPYSRHLVHGAQRTGKLRPSDQHPVWRVPRPLPNFRGCGRLPR